MNNLFLKKLILEELKNVLTEDEGIGSDPKFSIDDIVTDIHQEYVGRVSSIKWNAQREEFMYTLYSVPPYPWSKSLSITAPKSVLERHIKLFDKPEDFDENVRQEKLHPMLRGWSKGGV